MPTTPQLLPAGAFSTSGSQIIDQNGNPVRIACVGWSGSNARNGVPEGLYAANYQALLNQIVAIGFNCIRLTFCDASCINNDYPASGSIDTNLNPTMAGVSCFQVHDQIITYCGTIGLRVVIDSHNNEGANNLNYGANQPNGLWYDKGGASDGTDQGGNTGTVTDANFFAMWQAIATRYKNSSAILGYDLRNEPNTTGTQGPGNGGGSTWGDGSNRDIRAMYIRVGNAILAIDSRPLIICEGPQNYNGTFATGLQSDGINYGSGANWTGGSGDLSGVRQFPVTLTTPNKVYYSVHEYPPETTGNSVDQGGQAKITQMTAVWGYLAKNNTAPVWIGEMGSWFNGTAAQISQSTTWMNMMISYLNGTANGGPAFSGVQQGIGFDWWVFAVDENGGNVPDFGILTAWQNGSARQNQFTLYSQLFYTGSSSTPGSTGSTSPNGTLVPPSASIIDANANVWTITSGGQVAVNGVTDASTSSIVQLAYVSGLIWKETSGLLWAYKSTPTDIWINGANPLGAAPVPSPNGTVITTVGPAITDANGNLWSLNSTARVLINGIADLALIGVIELAFLSNRIWALTAGGSWYYRVLPTDPWLPTGGTLVSPLTAAIPRVTAPVPGTITLGTWAYHDITVGGVSLPSGKQIHFEVLLPVNYSTAVVYPVLIWLHPDGEANPWYLGQNTDPRQLSAYDANGWFNTLNFRQNYPAIIVVGYADQTGDGGNSAIENWGGWINTGATGSGTSFNGETGPNVFALNGVVAWVLANLAADPTRILLEGFSLGSIGLEYLLLRYNQVNGTPPLYTAGVSCGGGVVEIHGYGAGPSNADVLALTNVPAWFVSGAGDTASFPSHWNSPLWVALSGNTNYPAPGGTAAQARAGTSQYHYWLDPTGGHQQTDSSGNPWAINNTLLTWLFQQSGTGTVVTPPATGPANSTWNIVNGILAWAANQPVLPGARVQNTGSAYQCVSPGTTAASGGPMGTGGNILDGTARWKWLTTIDFFDKSGAQAALPTTFTSAVVWQFWNVAPQATLGGTPFIALSGHAMAGFSLTLTAAPGEGLRTALASQSLPLRLNTSYGATFLQPLAPGAPINYTLINDPSVIIDGLGFLDPLPTSGSTILQSQTGNTSLIVRNCIFDGASQAGGAVMVGCTTTGTVLFTNCLFIDRQPAGTNVSTVQVDTPNTSARFVNCTFIALNAPAVSVIAAFKPVVLRNCAIFGYTGAGNNASCTFDHCVTDQATWGSGGDGGNNLFSSTAAATFTDPLTDFRPLATSPLLNAGIADPADIPTADDIAGTPRVQGPGWDVGCWARLSFTAAEVRTLPNKFW